MSAKGKPVSLQGFIIINRRKIFERKNGHTRKKRKKNHPNTKSAARHSKIRTLCVGTRVNVIS